MASLEQEIEKLKANYAEKEAQLRREHEVLAVFGDMLEGYEKPMVHFSKLYGKRGSIHFNWSRYQSIKEGKNPDKELLTALLAKFPGVPIVRYKDGCTSFRPADAIEPELSKARERGLTVDLYDCGPVTVHLDPAQFSQSAKLEWVTRIGEELWEVVVEFPLYGTDFGQLNLQYDRYRDGEIRAVYACDFHPHAPWQSIKWGRGDHKTPNSFTLYMDPDSAKEADYARYVQKDHRA